MLAWQLGVHPLQLACLMLAPPLLAPEQNWRLTIETWRQRQGNPRVLMLQSPQRLRSNKVMSCR